MIEMNKIDLAFPVLLKVIAKSCILAAYLLLFAGCNRAEVLNFQDAPVSRMGIPNEYTYDDPVVEDGRWLLQLSVDGQEHHFISIIAVEKGQDDFLDFIETWKSWVGEGDDLHQWNDYISKSNLTWSTLDQIDERNDVHFLTALHDGDQVRIYVVISYDPADPVDWKFFLDGLEI